MLNPLKCTGTACNAQLECGLALAKKVICKTVTMAKKCSDIHSFSIFVSRETTDMGGSFPRRLVVCSAAATLIILFVIKLSLSSSVVQDLSLSLRECPVELTNLSGELASIRTVAYRGGILHNELGPFANSFDPDICIG
jgi:hypothetical protein